MRFTKFILVGAILCLEAVNVIAKPFFNPFNVAIQTSPTEDGGQKLSLLYPKKTSEVSISFKSEEINKNMINFASLLSSVASQFFKKFGSLSSSFGGKSAATTTEANFDFDNDGDDNSSSSFSSDSDLSSDSGTFSTKDEYSSLSLTKDGEYSSSSDDNSDSNSGYDYSTTAATKTRYDYPKPTTVNSYLPPVTEEIVYLPPNATPDSNYLPPN